MRSLIIPILFIISFNALAEVHILERKATAKKSLPDPSRVNLLLEKSDLLVETKDWDQLEKDLLIIKSNELELNELCEEYKGRIPCKKLKLLKRL